MSEANKKVALDFLAAMDVGDGEGMDRQHYPRCVHQYPGVCRCIRTRGAAK